MTCFGNVMSFLIKGGRFNIHYYGRLVTDRKLLTTETIHEVTTGVCDIEVSGIVNNVKQQFSNTFIRIGRIV